LKVIEIIETCRGMTLCAGILLISGFSKYYTDAVKTNEECINDIDLKLTEMSTRAEFVALELLTFLLSYNRREQSLHRLA
jgi:hypothetical protein